MASDDPLLEPSHFPVRWTTRFLVQYYTAIILREKFTTFYVKADKNAENQRTSVSPIRLEFSRQYPRRLTTD